MAAKRFAAAIARGTSFIIDLKKPLEDPKKEN